MNSIEKAPPAHLPTQCEACYRYCTPAGDGYARVYRYPANRPDRKAGAYTLRAIGPHGGTWTNRAPNERWPYRVETLSTEAPVVIVKGGKCADALAGLAQETESLGRLSIGGGRQGELLRVLKAGAETHGYKLVAGVFRRCCLRKGDQ